MPLNMKQLIHKQLPLFLYLTIIHLSLTSFASDDLGMRKNTSKSVALTKIESWNHVPTYPKEFIQLVDRKSDFNIRQTIDTEQNAKPIEIETILLKKLINSTHQHSNGIKILFIEPQLTISDFDKLTFDISIDNKQLKIPVLGNVINEYKLDSQQEIAAKTLFDNNAYLNFTLFGTSADDQSIKSIYGVKNVKIPRTDKATTSLKVVLNSEDFAYYWQQHWQRTYVEKQDVLSQAISTQEIKGVLITAETQNGKTLSHYLPNGLPATFDEAFIEIPITLRKPTLYIKTQVN